MDSVFISVDEGCFFSNRK